MNKNELIEVLAEKTNTTKAEAGRNLDAVLDTITETLEKGEQVSLAGFGIFEVKDRAARKGRNVKTGETIEIKASKAPRFKPSKTLKDRLNKK